jgi:hypothetical protein
MCDAIGHPVDRLRRTRIGGLSDRQIKPGQIRDLTPGEVAALQGATPNVVRRGAGARPPSGGPPRRRRLERPASGRRPPR